MAWQRYKTKYVGIYYRLADTRRCLDGKPDKCFEITYRREGKAVWEKIGWRSEGYSIEDAALIRGDRVRAIRHPELFGIDPQITLTFNELWEKIKEDWLGMLEKKRARQITWIYNLYIKPLLGDKQVQTILSIDVERIKKYLLKDYISEKTKRPLSRKTVEHILSVLQIMINKGKEHKISVKESSIDFTVTNIENRRERFLTKKEAFQLLESLKYHCCTTYYVSLISLNTGMRIIEILILKKENINLESKIINFNRKTGRRIAYIPDTLTPELKNIIPKDNDYIFKGEDGKIISRDIVYYRYMYVVNSLGLNDNITDNRLKVVFHTLRHTFCSWLAIKGVPLHTIAELAGHATLEMTKRYAKLSPGAKRKALNLISSDDEFDYE